MIGFGIDQLQAEYVADIRLRNINKEYILKRTQEVDALQEEIADLEDTVNSPKRIQKIIVDELTEVRKKYAYPRRRTESIRHAVHSSKISRTPITRGCPAMRMLKLQDWLSIRGVRRKSLAITFSGSVPRFRSMVSFRPDRSVSSRMSAISFSLPALSSSETLSKMASEVVE